jgi:outer membrane usher protein
MAWKRRFALSGLAAVAMVACASNLAATELRQLLSLEVVVNGQKTGTWLLLEQDAKLYAPHDAFEEWRVQLNPDTQSVSYKGQNYWPLDTVPGYQGKFNAAEQSLDVLFSPSVFSSTRLTQEANKKPVLSAVLPSAFFNYDLNYARSELRAAPTIVDLGMLGEVGISNGWGLLTNSFSARNLTRSAVLGAPSRLTRLETTFTRDFSGQNKTLRLGDSVTRTGLLGRNVYFGGIQFGSNFALTPGFVSQPKPVLTGISAAPSTVELYINDVLRQTSTVPTGPFAIDNLPTLSGNGDARIVVRDQLGRETVITQSFFTNGRLLAPGLEDWGVEAGRLREDLGIANAKYGSAFASGIWRRGFNSSLTLEGRTELTRNLRTLQAGAIAGLPFELLGNAAVTGSHLNNVGRGMQWLLGLEYSGLRSSTFFQAQGASKDFRQLGQPADASPTKSQLAANWTYSLPNQGTLGIGYASVSRYDSRRVDSFNASYSLRFNNQVSLNLIANRVLGQVRAASLGVNLTFLFERNRSATVTTNSRSGVNDVYATVSQNPDLENPLGMRALVGQLQNQERQEGGLFYRGQRGVVTADVSRNPNQTAVRLGVNGGVVLADGHVFATQRLTDSFALVEVKDYGNIGVGLGSHVQTQTDASGVGVVMRLTPYMSNQIRLNATELPINAEITSLEQYAVPAYRSAVKVIFPVRSGRGALLNIVLDDGDVAPAGATAQIDGDKEEFYVARRGEAFVTGLQTKNRVTLSWNGQRCTFEVSLPEETRDEFPRIGPLACQGVTR